MTAFRACYYVALDGQSDVCLTNEDMAHLSDADLIEAAMAEARSSGLIGDVTGLGEEEVRDHLHIGEYRR